MNQASTAIMPKTVSSIPFFEEINYRTPSHKDLPHIVKFSGGRSSAAMSLLMAEQKMLTPSRGDIVLFANTSAEHPGTYDFAAKCKALLESRYNLPCFWYEFCTVEDSMLRRRYTRQLTYRLVNACPVEESLAGYRSRGEVFEEMLSFQKMLPNPQSRTCTAKLKLLPAHILIAEWLSGANGPAHAGHYDETPHIDIEALAEMHIANGGHLSREEYLSFSEHITNTPHCREEQDWQDYTEACLLAPTWIQESARSGAYGKDAPQFVTLLGLRADEPSRIDRIMSRTLFAEGARSPKCQVSTQPPGEHPYFPMHESGWDKETVMEFWDNQDFDLNIPDGNGNCVFCFMKGSKSLHQMSACQNGSNDARAGTPVDIRWWKNMEEKYGREVPSRKGKGTTKFGFFGAKALTYGDIMNQDFDAAGRYANTGIACDCTD